LIVRLVLVSFKANWDAVRTEIRREKSKKKKRQEEKRTRHSTNEQFDEARRLIEAGASVLAATKATGVAETTLRDRVSGRKPWHAKHGGANQVLTTEEEKTVVCWALEMADRGIPVTISMIQDEVEYVLSGDTRATPFTDGRPGRRWAELFLNRNETVRERVAQLVSKGRMLVTEELAREWHQGLLEKIIAGGYTEAFLDPKRRFNMDETGFQLEASSGRRQKVVVSSSLKQHYAMKPGTRTMITIITCMGADGMCSLYKTTMG
jgi:hypothetical protein